MGLHMPSHFLPHEPTVVFELLVPFPSPTLLLALSLQHLALLSMLLWLNTEDLPPSLLSDLRQVTALWELTYCPGWES